MLALKMFVTTFAKVGHFNLQPFSGHGDRSSNTNPVYTDTDALNLVNMPDYSGVQYFGTSEPQIAGQQQPIELTETQPDITVEPLKTNYGTKGINRLFPRIKSKQQSEVTQTVPLLPISYATSPEQFFTGGYLEPILTANTTTEGSKGGKFRSYLPWNWVFVRSQKVEPVQVRYTNYF